MPIEHIAPRIFSKLEAGGIWSFVGGTTAGYRVLQRRAAHPLIKMLFGSKPPNLQGMICPNNEPEVVAVLEKNGFEILTSETYEPELQFPDFRTFMDFTYHGGWLLWWLTRSYHNTADRNLTVSSVMAEDLRRRGFERVALWPPAVDSVSYSPDRRHTAMRRRLCGNHQESPLLLTVSRLASEMNVSFLTEVLRRVPEATLAIVGDGPQQAELERRSARYKTQFVGYLYGEELAAAYASAENSAPGGPRLHQIRFRPYMMKSWNFAGTLVPQTLSSSDNISLRSCCGSDQILHRTPFAAPSRQSLSESHRAACATPGMSQRGLRPQPKVAITLRRDEHLSIDIHLPRQNSTISLVAWD